MLEPPSEQLWQRLRDELLCTSSDLRNARRRVQYLTRDLPAFDSVWIDALVQVGRLTPYQAWILESEPAAKLRIGPYILLDELGRGSGSRTLLARRDARSERVVVKFLRVPDEQRATAVDRARQLVAQASAVRHQCLSNPWEFSEHDDGLLLVSPYVSGLPLTDLLVRRGRFPSEVVTAIARQLIDGLSAWHRAGLVHGDIRRSHVRITETGAAVLVEAGLRSLVPADITVYAPLAEEAYDGVAPELIGVGRAPAPAADWYALGCVLWQLLAGRPPFPMADPLAKLAAHQTRTVEDVSEWAPETPAALAKLVRGLTQFEPERRLAMVEDHRRCSGPPTSRDRRTIARFRRAFDSAVPHLRSGGSNLRYRWPLALGAGCLSAAIAAMLADTGLRTEVLSLAANWTHALKDDARTVQRSFSADLLSMPAPSPDGTIVLTESGPYAAATIHFPGTLTLRAAVGVCPVILVRDQPLRIAAEHWKCDGVRLQFDRLFRAAPPTDKIVDVVARHVTWEHCCVDLGVPPRRSATDLAVTAVAWRPIEDGSTAAPATLRLQHCLLHGTGSMFASIAPGSVKLENVLHLGQGPLLTISASNGDAPLTVEMKQVTLRDSGPLVRFQLLEPTASPKARVIAEDCVLQPRSGHAVLEYIAAASPVLAGDSLTWSGEGSLLAPNASLLHWVNSTSAAREEVTAESASFDGLTVGQVRYSGLSSTSPADSVVTDAETPRRSPEPPGITASLFGACWVFPPETTADLP